MLGFFLAPLMGSLSDRCTFRWGRRRPLILLLSLLIFTGLILVPWGQKIGIFLEGEYFENATILANQTFENASFLTSNQTFFEDTSNSAAPFHFYKWAAIITIIGTIFLDFSADTCQTPARTYMLDICISGKFNLKLI